MTTVVPRPPREYRSSNIPLQSPRGSHFDSPFNHQADVIKPPELPPQPLPFGGGLSIPLHDGGLPRGSLMPPSIGHRQLKTYRPMAEELKRYIDALAGPTERTPLLYTGDPQTSLDRLHHDAVQHYRMLSHQLGEHERRDLTADPTSLLTYGGARGGYGHLLGAGLGGGEGEVGRHLMRLPDAAVKSSFTPSLPSLGMGPSLYGDWGRQMGGGIYGVGGPGINIDHFGGYRRQAAVGGPSGSVWEGRGGVRESGFALGAGAGRDPNPSSLMSNEQSRLIYPPVGSTFEGYASRGVLAARSQGKGIDSMADMTYRKAQPLQYGNLLQEAAGADAFPRSQQRSERDQLDAFLSDFAGGRTKGLEIPASLSSGNIYRSKYI